MLSISNCPILNKDNYSLPNGESCIKDVDKFSKEALALIEKYNSTFKKLEEAKNHKNFKNAADEKPCKEFSNNLELICKILKKDFIQIGFLGPSNAGKSTIINALFGKGLCATGSGGTTTSSCVVSYYSDKKNTNLHTVTFMDKTTLELKCQYVLENICDRKYTEIQDWNLILDELLNSNKVPSDSNHKEFFDLYRSRKIPFDTTKELTENDEFKRYVNHNLKNETDNKSITCHSLRHAVLKGRSPGLQTTDVPEVIEIVDVPGLGANKFDNLNVEKYYKNIDAWIIFSPLDLPENDRVIEYIKKSKDHWKFENDEKGLFPDFSNRFIFVFSQIGLLKETNTTVYDKVKKTYEEYKDKFFMTDTKIFESPDRLRDSDRNILECFQFYKSSNKNSENIIHHKNAIEKDGFLKSAIEVVNENGGIPNLKEFILKKWPEKIISEIIKKATNEITKYEKEINKFLETLGKRNKLNIAQSDQINKAIKELNDIKNKLLSNFDELQKPLKSFINNSNIKNYTVQGNSPAQIQQATNFLRTESSNISARLLSLIISPDGWIQSCYGNICDKFSDIIVRNNIESTEELSLSKMLKDKIPLKISKIDNLIEENKKTNQKKVHYFAEFDVHDSYPSCTRDEMIAFLEDNFRNTLFNQTGLDEYTDKFKKTNPDINGKNIDLMDWVSNVLQTDRNNEKFNFFKEFMKKGLMILAIDCATVIRNRMIEDINSLIDRLQNVQDQG